MQEHSQLKQRGGPLLGNLKKVHLQKCPTKSKFGDGIKSLRKKVASAGYKGLAESQCQKKR